MKGEYGEPWRGTTYDSSIVNSLNAYVVCAPNDIIMARIVACVNACDGIAPEKLAAFLDANVEMLCWVNTSHDRIPLTMKARLNRVFGALTAPEVGK